jgi:hypothetical protein
MLIDSLTTDALKAVREEYYEKVIEELGGGENIQNIF